MRVLSPSILPLERSLDGSIAKTANRPPLSFSRCESTYLFKEIEFYFYNKNHRDIITHPRVSKPLCWYVNDFGGIDLNFESKIKYENRLNSKGKNVKKYVLDDSAYFGGILIRQLISSSGSREAPTVPVGST